jgi:hypothetical protein
MPTGHDLHLLMSDLLVKDELRIGYPVAWEAEYRATGHVARWHQMYPDLWSRHLATRLAINVSPTAGSDE